MIKLYFTLLILILIDLQLGCTEVSNPNEKDSIISIEGRWQVIETSFYYFKHPSSCDSLGINCIYSFDNGKFELFKDNNFISCLVYPQTYRIDSSAISFCEIDMVFDYKIIELSRNELVLNSFQIVPTSLYSRLKMDSTDLPYRLSKEGITLKLKRI
jgi:hypothetical protein